MKAQFTPGEWEFDPNNLGVNTTHGWGIVDAKRGASIGVTVHAPTDPFDGPFSDEAQANARLIAAAPDLAEAVAELIKLAGPDGDFQNNAVRVYDMARAALQKAGVEL